MLLSYTAVSNGRQWTRRRKQSQKNIKRMTRRPDHYSDYEANADLQLQDATIEERQKIYEQIKAELRHHRRMEIGMLVLSILLIIAAFGWCSRNLM